MGKFGIGARVRDRDGDLAEVIGKRKGERLIHLDEPYDFEYWAKKADLTAVEVVAVPPADEPKFKVDQRVVMIREVDGEFSPVVARIVADDGQDYLPLQIEFEAKVDFGHGASPTWYVDPADIAPFTLEAGKFYRTRDDRKVGPMVPGHYAEEWPLTVDHSFDSGMFGKAWRADGTFDPDRNSNAADIVAEWVEPAASAAAADAIVVEDATDLALVVVAGKRYRGKSGVEYDVVDNSGNEFWPLTNADFDRFWKADGTAYNEGRWNPNSPEGDDLVALVAPQPKFKVGDRVDLMRDGEPVEKWSNMTITSIDHSEFIYPISTDVGLPCFESELRLSQPQIPTLSVDDEVTLSAPARISGFDKKNAHVVLDTGGSFVLPIASLRLAA